MLNSELEVTVGEIKRIDFTLSVGEITEEVTPQIDIIDEFRVYTNNCSAEAIQPLTVGTIPNS